jgi:hypothetical protein
MSRRGEMHARMVFLKNDGLLYHSKEIHQLRLAIDAIDAAEEAKAKELEEGRRKWQETWLKKHKLKGPMPEPYRFYIY